MVLLRFHLGFLIQRFDSNLHKSLITLKNLKSNQKQWYNTDIKSISVRVFCWLYCQEKLWLPCRAGLRILCIHKYFSIFGSVLDSSLSLSASILSLVILLNEIKSYRLWYYGYRCLFSDVTRFNYMMIVDVIWAGSRKPIRKPHFSEVTH